MPIEIRELQITAVIQDNPQPVAATPSPVSTASQEAIINACVEQVLRILKEKTER